MAQAYKKQPHLRLTYLVLILIGSINIVVVNNMLSSLLDKHAQLKRIYVVNRAMNDGMTDYILALKLFDVNMSHFAVKFVSLFTFICNNNIYLKSNIQCT